MMIIYLLNYFLILFYFYILSTNNEHLMGVIYINKLYIKTWKYL